CQQGEECLTHHLWCDLSDQIHGFLSQISLSNLVERREVKNVSARQEARSVQGESPALTEV
ncbi:MAG: Rrf2 family transcriptional regulator, partial [Gammaproteobacteria bacterium]